MKTYTKSYISDGEIFTEEDIFQEQIKFINFIGTEIEQYIKEGSLKIIDKADEIYIKLPNWGDVKLYWHNNPLSFTDTDKKFNEKGKEIEPDKITVNYNFLVTKVKMKVQKGDNSGYTKYYFTNLCWIPRQKTLHTTIHNCTDIVSCLLKNDPPKEYDSFRHSLINDKSASYFDLGGEGV